MPLLSLCLATYNRARYLDRHLTHHLDALEASGVDYELVVSDNASTDATEEICRSYAGRDKRVRYIRQLHNVGAAANHNLLFREAQAPYFKWAAHDDILAPTFLAACVDALERHPEVVVASPATVLIDDDGSPLSYSAQRGGFVTDLHAETVGVAGMLLGAGRDRAEDAVDPAVGVMITAHVGQAVREGETVFEVHYRDAARLGPATQLLSEACEIGDAAPEARPRVHEILDAPANP